MIKVGHSCIANRSIGKRQRSYWSPSSTAWFFLDAITAYVAMRMAFALSPSFNPMVDSIMTEHASAQEAGVLFAFFTAVCSHIFGLHNPLLPRELWTTLTRCAGATFLSMGFVAAVVFAVLYHRLGRFILLQGIGYNLVLLTMARIVVWRQLAQRKQRLLLLGAGEIGVSLVALIRESELPFEVVAFVDEDCPVSDVLADPAPVLGNEARLAQHCEDLQIDEVVNCMAGRLTEGLLAELMECLNTGVRVRNFSGFVESNFYHVPVEFIGGEWFLHANLEYQHFIYQAIKRGVDIVVAILGLLFFTPILLLAAVAIKLQSPGRIFYSQIRTGRLNGPFRIWKLRTMRSDAEKDGPRWASDNDDRVFWVGRVLRKTRLDEAPQFWNVLVGDMSLVGPRPERPEFVDQLASDIPFYHQRHLVKPGLTGWAQINYPYGASSKDAMMKLKYDLFYIKHASVALDLQIMLRTVGVVMKGSR